MKIVVSSRPIYNFCKRIISNEDDLSHLDFNLGTLNKKIPNCDILIYSGTINDMFKDHNPKPHAVDIRKIIVLSDWEGGFSESFITNAVNSIKSKYSTPNVVFITQNELASNFDSIHYIHKSWTHGLDVAYWPKNAHTLSPLESPPLDISMTFGTMRHEKYLLYKHLESKNILKHKRVSFLSGSARKAEGEPVWADKNNINLESITNHKLKINNEIVTDDKMKDFFVSQNFDLLHGFNHERKDYLFYVQLYMMLHSKVNLVVETEMKNDTNRYTEKTMKPIAIKQPFIIAGNHNTLKLLLKDGFKTFHPYIDESYDNEENTSKRIDLITNELNKILSMNKSEWLAFKKNINPILNHNQKRLSSISEKYLNTLKQQLIST